ncbi:MAG TPA: RDD family protein [Vicinamibacterales bacterium]|nr:RDD family protein [Vicinamibacterales bacterium]
MRCPKCHYITFEPTERCRNCGYDFALAASPPEATAELPLNDRDEAPQPPVDLSLSQVEGLGPAERASPPRFDLDALEERGSATPFDLPLFKAGAPPSPRAAIRARHDAVDDGAPLIKPSAVPRAPIAVRRATPDAHRLRSRYALAEVPRLDLEPPAPAAEPAAVEAPGPGLHPAPPGRRLLAGLIDVAIVGGINAAVLYFTLKLCELPLTAAGLVALPVVPLIGFFLMLDGGYFVTFTAAVGQTIGKMATGLRVVQVVGEDEEREAQPNFGFAVLRTAAYAASLLPAGLGFLPALFGRDRRALHDRLAETRVIVVA